MAVKKCLELFFPYLLPLGMRKAVSYGIRNAAILTFKARRFTDWTLDIIPAWNNLTHALKL